MDFKGTKEEKMDLIGEWKTRCGCIAVVEAQVAEIYFGTLLMPTWTQPGKELLPMVPTYWNKDGRNKNYGFDLIERRRGQEQWK